MAKRNKKMHISTQKASVSGLLSAFENSKKPFSIEMTGGSVTVKMENIADTILSMSSLTFKELNFVKRVKKYAQDTGIEKQAYGPHSIRYFGFIKTKVGVHTDVVELDINAAYWNTALSLGYISAEIHKEGLGVSKVCRLVALGSFATRKRVFDYDTTTGKYIQLKDVYDPVMRSYFFHIAYTVGKIVYGFAEMFPGSTLFFWVDALFLHSNLKAACIEYFRESGLELHDKNIEYVEVIKGEAFDYDYRVKDAKGIRRFVMKRGKLENQEAKGLFEKDVQRIKKGKK